MINIEYSIGYTASCVARILQKNYKGSLQKMEAFEEQQLMDWKALTDHKK